MLTLALSSWSLHRRLPNFNEGPEARAREAPALSVLEFPGLAASLGIAEIELCQAHLAKTDEAYLDEVRDAVEVAGCRVINVPIDVGNLAVADPEGRQTELDRILPWIEVARILGSPAVRVNTGQPGAMSEARALEVVAEGYRRLAAFCADRGMLILLENHGGLSSSPAAIMELLELVDAPNFRLCPDFGNFAPEVREEGLRAMLPYAAVVHAKILDGQRSFDLDRCLQLVRESGYAGPLSIEYEGTGDEVQGVMRARDFLRSRLAGEPGPSHGAPEWPSTER